MNRIHSQNEQTPMSAANHSLDRRGFLRLTAWTSAATVVGLNPHLLLAQGGGGGGGYRALVVVALDGGADTHAFLVPRGAEHAAYAAARGPLSVPTADLLSLPTSGTGGLELGMHARLVRMKDLYDQGKLAFVPNVGALVEPLNATQFHNQTRDFPRYLFSHNSQRDFWHQGRADQDINLGWAGQAADLLNGGSGNVPFNVSLGQVTRLQIGRLTAPYTIRASGVADYPLSGARRQVFESLLEQDGHASPMVREYARQQQRAREQHELVGAALAQAPNLTTPFPAPGEGFVQFNLSGQLRMVAQLIAAREAMGATRQIFYVSIDGWDTHDDPELETVLDGMSEIDAALGAFQDALGELGVGNQVTTMTVSEFGRSLTSNGRGSDHGWGGHYMVFGDAVDGGRLHGDFPDLTLDGPRDAGAGRLVPTTSFDQYAATALAWMGLSPSQLDEVFPTLANFPSPTLNFLI